MRTSILIFLVAGLLLTGTQPAIGQACSVGTLAPDIINTTNTQTTGQSYTMSCPNNGTWTTLTVQSNVNNTGVTLRIFEGAGFDGALKYTQTGIVLSATTLTDQIPLQGGTGSLDFTAGSIYTFQLEATAGGNLRLARDVPPGIDLYNGGTEYNRNGSALSNQDLYFVMQATVGGVLPVELIRFVVRKTDEGIALRWSTASEINNEGFAVERRSGLTDWREIGFVEGRGEAADYSFVDENPPGGTGFYRLKQIDFDGAFEYSPVRSIRTGEAERVTVYPNPVNSGGTLSLAGELPESLTIMELLDQMGKVVRRADIRTAGGRVKLGADLPPGTYYLRAIGARTSPVILSVVVR